MLESLSSFPLSSMYLVLQNKLIDCPLTLKSQMQIITHVIELATTPRAMNKVITMVTKEQTITNKQTNTNRNEKTIQIGMKKPIGMKNEDQ